MGTSKEMQLRIIDKIRKNIEDDIHTMSGIEYEVAGEWYEVKKSLAHVFNMNVTRYRLKPETITINGVDIPKPLSKEQLEGLDCCLVYYPTSIKPLFDACYSDDIFTNYFDGVICYEKKEEAIEASKLLFGIK